MRARTLSGRWRVPFLVEKAGWRGALGNARRCALNSVARDGTIGTLRSPASVFVADLGIRTLASVREMALWLYRRRRRWCRRGALPVLCVVRARGLERVEGGVLTVSLDRLVPALRVAAGLSKRPAFLAGV